MVQACRYGVGPVAIG